jgi:hypothetical protein
MRIQFLTVASMKMAAFWNIALCSVVEVDRRFRCAYSFHYQGNDGGSTHL